MKKFLLAFLLIPVVCFSQSFDPRSSPSDYMWKFVGTEGFSYPGVSNINLEFNSAGILYISFIDAGSLSVMNFDGSTWNYVGQMNFSNKLVESQSFAISPSGDPYVVFADISNGICVMKYDGSAWNYVGQEDFVNGSLVCIAFNQTEHPYIGFEDSGAGGRGSVISYTGTQWNFVGMRGFSMESTDKPVQLSISTTGEPFFCIKGGSGPKISVYRFDGTNWVIVGPLSFSPSTYFNLSFGLSPSDQPYVAFDNADQNYQERVMTFDGTNWTIVGSPEMSVGLCEYSSLAFNKLGEPCIAMQDSGMGNKATVMKYSEGNWSYIGSAEVSPGRAKYESLAFHPDGTPFLAYRDETKQQMAAVMKFDSVYVGNYEKPQQSLVKIYPNPANDYVYIDQSEKGVKNISLYNQLGEKILEIHSSNKIVKLSIKDIPTGIYYLKVTSAGYSCMKKFCKR
jgi:hypothetical protein